MQLHSHTSVDERRWPRPLSRNPKTVLGARYPIDPTLLEEAFVSAPFSLQAAAAAAASCLLLEAPPLTPQWALIGPRVFQLTRLFCYFGRVHQSDECVLVMFRGFFAVVTFPKVQKSS